MIVRLLGIRTVSEIEEVILHRNDPYRMFGLARREVKNLLESGGLEVVEICEMERPGLRMYPVICQTEIPYYRNSGERVMRRLKLFIVATDNVSEYYNFVNSCHLPKEAEVLGMYFKQFGWDCKACLSDNRRMTFYSVKEFGDFTAFLQLDSVEDT